MNQNSKMHQFPENIQFYKKYKSEEPSIWKNQYF